MTSFSKLSSSLLVAALALVSVPALAQDPAPEAAPVITPEAAPVATPEAKMATAPEAAPAAAPEGKVEAAPAAGPACACEDHGPMHKVKQFMMEKDEAGTPRAVKWGVGAVGAAALATTIVVTGVTFGSFALAPQCARAPGACKAIVTQAFTRPHANQSVAGAGTAAR